MMISLLIIVVTYSVINTISKKIIKQHKIIAKFEQKSYFKILNRMLNNKGLLI